MAVAPDHPLAAAAATKNPALAAFIAECQQHRHRAGGDRDRREEGLRHRHRGRCIRSTRTWKLPVYVANFILMDYGTGAIFGCPAHDQRDLDFARKYGARRYPGGAARPAQDPKTFVITDTAYDGDGRMINSRFLDGMTIEEAKEEVAQPAGERDARQSAGGAAQGQLPPARLGHLAPALLGLPDPGDPLRGVRRRAGAGRPTCR